MFNMFNLICRYRCSVANLGISRRNPQINSLFSLSLSSFSSSSSSKDSAIVSSVTVDYLINSCGFPPKKAMKINPDIADSVLAFLKNYGFTQTQILSLGKRRPQILSADPEKTLLPKLEFLRSVGLSSSDVARVITLTPGILATSLEDKIVPCYNLFRNLLQSDEKTITLIKQCPTLFTHYIHASVIQNIQYLRELGVPESHIVRLVAHQARDLLFRPPDMFRQVVEEVKKMGFDPLRGNFVWAIQNLGSMSKSTWEKKVEMYKKWGLSREEVLVAFGKTPWFMQVSEEKIERVMDFIINKMGMKSSVLVQYPIIITASLEKRVVPRLLFYKVLLDRGLIKEEMEFSFHPWLHDTEKDFISRIIKNYKEEAPQLLKLYQSKLNPAK